MHRHCHQLIEKQLTNESIMKRQSYKFINTSSYLIVVWNILLDAAF